MKKVFIPFIMSIFITAESVSAATVNLVDIDNGDYRIDNIVDVVIDSTHYDIAFHHDASFNTLPSIPRITFTTEADADAAINAINAAILALNFDATAPGTLKTGAYWVPMELV